MSPNWQEDNLVTRTKPFPDWKTTNITSKMAIKLWDLVARLEAEYTVERDKILNES